MSLERQGVPTATFITQAFATYAQGLCRMQGMEVLPLIIIPHPVAARPQDELREKVRAVYGQVQAALVET